MSLSIFFPCYNDAGTIAGLVRSAAETARRLDSEFEIVVVDDGSRDDSPGILERLRDEIPELRVVTHPRNLGYGAALRSGFAEVRHELVFYTDGDGQYDPRELRALWPGLTADVDWVNGWKLERSDPRHRVLLGELYRRLVRKAFGLKLKDPHCDFRLIRRRVLDRIVLESDSGAICVELVSKLQRSGARLREVPVRHYPRSFGRSRFFSPLRLARLGVGLARLWAAPPSKESYVDLPA